MLLCIRRLPPVLLENDWHRLASCHGVILEFLPTATILEGDGCDENCSVEACQQCRDVQSVFLGWIKSRALLTFANVNSITDLISRHCVIVYATLS